MQSTDILPATSHTLLDLAGPIPQNMSELDKLEIGLLLATTRVQEVALSSEPTQRSCHVEWAETEAAAARRTRLDFIVMSDMLGRNWSYWSESVFVVNVCGL